jgi:hypothetical protein
VTLYAAGEGKPLQLAQGKSGEDGTFKLAVGTDKPQGAADKVLYLVARGGTPKAAAAKGANDAGGPGLATPCARGNLGGSFHPLTLRANHDLSGFPPQPLSANSRIALVWAPLRLFRRRSTFCSLFSGGQAAMIPNRRGEVDKGPICARIKEDT